MADLIPSPIWSPVPQLETSTQALAGPGGPMNTQAQALLNRIEKLKQDLAVKTGQVVVNVGASEGGGIVYSGIASGHVMVLKVEVDADASDRYDIEIYDGAIASGGTLIYRAQQVLGAYADSLAFYHPCQNADLHARLVNLRQDGASFSATVKIALMLG